jgi:ATP-dependent protease ClpP protease subunit
MRENLHLLNRLLEILAQHTGQTFEKVKNDSDRDYFMSPQEAKDYGLIDEVFTGNNDSLISMAQAAGGTVPTAEAAAEADKPKK